MSVTDDTRRETRRRAPLGRRGLALGATAVVVLVIAGAVAYAAVLMPSGGRGTAALHRSSGPLKITDSRGRNAILRMRNMKPGDRVAGSVRIGNGSKRIRARISVRLTRWVETPGKGGARFSQRLVLLVQRMYSRRRPRTLYRGPLRQMRPLRLGTFRPGEKRTYRFTVRFPRGSAAVDNRFQGGSVRMQFTWYAVEVRR